MSTESDEAASVDRRFDLSQPVEQLHENERLKLSSRFLRGSIESGLADRVTGGLAAPDTQLTKFHGFYQQDDRDLRDERRRQKLEPAYQMMVRLRLPGGICTPTQWLALDEIADRQADGGLRLTTRQTFQFHGVHKGQLKPLMQRLQSVDLDTRAACGDVNRTVMAASNPNLSVLHAVVREQARTLSDYFAPKTRAYDEIWLGSERLDTDDQEEPIYGPTYLPRKFKIGFAVPPINDIDVFSQDLGFIAIEEEGRLLGFNVCVGGGMGRTDKQENTYPRVADVIGFCTPEQVLSVALGVLTIQREYGNRADRSRARLKYTIDTHGLAWFVAELNRRLELQLPPSRPFHFQHNGDRYGWLRGDDGLWHYTLFIENGRVRDSDESMLKSAMRAIAAVHDGEFRLTPNQNLIVANVSGDLKPRIESLLEEFGLSGAEHASPLRRNAMACVALPTCGLAMAESERYLPELIDRLEALARDAGIETQPITIRMTGCPNGCARPYLAEIGLTGRAPGKYNLYLGGDPAGQRLNRLFLENIGEAKILEALDELFRRFAAGRRAEESFGDFVLRDNVV